MLAIVAAGTDDQSSPDARLGPAEKRPEVFTSPQPRRGSTGRWLEFVADPIRLQILASLSKVRDATASDLVARSDASRQTLRRHLEALVAVGVIRERPGTCDGETPGRPASRFSLPADVRESVLAVLGEPHSENVA